jgi:uncharacterized protein (DUF849 family)
MTLVKACQNGGTTRAQHLGVPQTPGEIARDGAACVAAGAGALHFHVRERDGKETLSDDETALALRVVKSVVPDVPVGLTTALWIAGDDAELRHRLVTGWTRKPDFASVNLDEAGAVELGEALLAAGVAIEAGVSFVEDVALLAESPLRDRFMRVLIEPDDEDADAAVARAAAIEAALDDAGIEAPRLHHGYGLATWAVIDAGLKLGRDVRIGLEDTTVMPDGTPPHNNAELVAAVAALAAAP